MVATILANGISLARIVVPKALLHQTGQLLHSRLGGLLGRSLCHVPFSRRTSTKESHIKLYASLHRDALKSAGVMLCLPEHSLSFMLSGLQRLFDNEVPQASQMLKTQHWLKSCCRDVLDESDYTLAVRTQLIYPSGSQLSVDGHPHRWQITQSVLALVDAHLYNLSVSFPYSIEVYRRPMGGFPLIFFLRSDVEDELIRRLISDICQGCRGILPIESMDQRTRVAVKEFLSNGKIGSASLDRIKNICPDQPHIRQIVYLLRGLLVHRILLLTLKKRWNVQYGLHPQRDPIAVPYHAKGVPSEQSEWGHSDGKFCSFRTRYFSCPAPGCLPKNSMLLLRSTSFGRVYSSRRKSITLK